MSGLAVPRHSRERGARQRESSARLPVVFGIGFPLCASLGGNDEVGRLPAAPRSSTLSPRLRAQHAGTAQARHMSDFDYDLFVIGGGSGGVRAARISANHGAKVAVAEEYRLGGTCVIRGCVPKKLFVYASRFRDEFEDAAGFGWSVEEPYLRLADAGCQQGCRDHATGGPLPHRPRARRRDDPAGARRAHRPAHGDRAAGRPQDHGALYPGGDRRAPGSARRAGSRPRHHLQRGVPPRQPAEVDRDRAAAATSPWSSQASSPASGSRPRCSTGARRSCAASTRSCATTSRKRSSSARSTCGATPRLPRSRRRARASG